MPSATHMHLGNQTQLENAYRYGIRHFPISNYYPSVPYDDNTWRSDFTLRQWWPVTRDGRRIEPPINWNDIVSWQDELEEPHRSQLPFEETDRAGSISRRLPQVAAVLASANWLPHPQRQMSVGTVPVRADDHRVVVAQQFIDHIPSPAAADDEHGDACGALANRSRPC